MQLPFITRRRAQANLDLATAALRISLCVEKSAREKAEARAAQLDQRLYELQLATELHDQQQHTKEDAQ